MIPSFKKVVLVFQLLLGRLPRRRITRSTALNFGGIGKLGVIFFEEFDPRTRQCICFRLLSKKSALEHGALPLDAFDFGGNANQVIDFYYLVTVVAKKVLGCLGVDSVLASPIKLTLNFNAILARIKCNRPGGALALAVFIAGALQAF